MATTTTTTSDNSTKVRLWQEEDDETNHYQRCWCFTWHISSVVERVQQALGREPSVPDLRRDCEKGMENFPDYKYLFAGFEQCPTTGSWHYQGYVHFAAKKRRSALEKLCESKISWRAAKADWECNWTYCTKFDKQPFVKGDLPADPSAGEREKSDWDEAWQLAKTDQIESIRADIRLKHYHVIRNIARDYQAKPVDLQDYNNEWVWGTTGSGKSTLARRENPDAYPKNCNKWFCGYQGEGVVIIDDIDPESAKMLARYIKIWCDKFPFVAEMKGTSMMIRPLKFVFTSQYQIEECFTDPRDAAAIRRRMRVRRVVDFAEAPDTFVENAPAGTVGNFIPATPVQTPATLRLDAPSTQQVVEATPQTLERQEEIGSNKRTRIGADTIDQDNIIDLCDDAIDLTEENE